MLTTIGDYVRFCLNKLNMSYYISVHEVLYNAERRNPFM